MNKTFKERNLYFLSNMYICNISYNNIIFNSSEKLYQYLKISSDDKDLINLILSEDNPYKIKSIMKQYNLKNKFDKDFLINNMYIAVFNKFDQNEEIKNKLLLINDEDLIEYNYWNDTFWGININTNKGNNNLGKILQKVKLQLFYKSKGVNLL